MTKPKRELPYSIEAEEHLLSSCMLDGQDVLARCVIKRVTAESFYDPKHGIIFGAILDLYNQGQSTDVALVAEKLKEKGQLDQVGGIPFVAQVSGRSPTIAQASFFMDRVIEQATLREMIRQFSGVMEDCYGYSGNIQDLIEGMRHRLDKLATGADVSTDLRRADSFELPPQDDDTCLFGRNRYISRGDGVIIVSSSGMGKSVLNYEWAALAGLGRPFLGIHTRKPLKSLIIQAEDADGDVGEVMYSLKVSLKLTESEMKQVGDNVVIVREKIHRGEAFLARLRALVNKVKPDIVWINPLHAYAGCDIADAEEHGRFLRAGLNALNKDERFAIILIHHTPKPITSKGVPDRKWHEVMYEAAGSAELVNWARAVIVIKPTEEQGKFNLILAKRGGRAGVMMEVTSEAGIPRLELTTKIPIQHSNQKVHVEGRKEPFHIVHWEARDPDVEKGSKDKNEGQFDQKYPSADMVEFYPSSSEEGHAAQAVLRHTQANSSISRARFFVRQKEMCVEGLIEKTPDFTWRRTKKGDELVNENLRKTP